MGFSWGVLMEVVIGPGGGGGGTFNEGSVRELAGRGKLAEVRPQMGKQGSKLGVEWGGNTAGWHLE